MTPQATPMRPNRRPIRRNLQLPEERVPSPIWNRSPGSDDLQNVLNNAFVNHDPDGVADQFGNAEAELADDPMEYFDLVLVEQQEEQEQEEEPVIQYEEVPVEEPPLEHQEVNYDEMIRINFSISFVNDQFVPQEQQDGEEALDAGMELIENAPASPPDVNGYIALEE